MAGFTEDTFTFLADLEANNSRDWFEANRDRYEAHWRDPAIAFIEHIAPRMGALDPPLTAEARLNGSLRRINRDVRFSRDKSPYEPSLHIVFWAGDHPNRSPGLHYVLRPDGVGYGAGMWGLKGAVLERWRDLIVDPIEGPRVRKAIADAATVGCTLGEPELARVPKGREADGETADLLRHKSFVLRTHDSPASRDVLIGDAAADWAMSVAHPLMPAIRVASML